MYNTITIFTIISFQNNGPRRTPLRQNYVAGMGVTQMRYLYAHVYIIFYIGMHIYIIIYGWQEFNINMICLICKSQNT